MDYVRESIEQLIISLQGIHVRPHLQAGDRVQGGASFLGHATQPRLPTRLPQAGERQPVPPVTKWGGILDTITRLQMRATSGSFQGNNWELFDRFANINPSS